MSDLFSKMSQITKKLLYLDDTKEAIKAKLLEKGVAVSESDTFRSYAEKIDEIKGGAGSGDAVVWYVTFIGADGSELFKMPVLDGDDCKDPKTHGDITTPTKESSLQYNYTYSGWSATSGGSANSSVLKSIKEDKTVYAAFTSSTRKYTITFYDGDTLLETQSVDYGSVPTIENPMKDGYSFDSWSPPLATVTKDASYNAVWSEKPTFAGSTWADIAEISEAGEASNYFKVGDIKTITVGDQEMRFVIIGFNHDDLANGSGKAGMTILANRTFADTMPIDDWNTLSSTMKSKLKPQLPSDLQSVIKPVIKQCDVTQTGAGLTPLEVSFELFPLSYAECKIQAQGGRKITDSDWANYFSTLGTAYQYFSDNYNTQYMGPYNTVYHTYPYDNKVYVSELGNCWLRQYLRFGTGKNLTAAYRSVNLGSATKQWCDSDSRTSNRTVMLAFCI